MDDFFNTADPFVEERAAEQPTMEAEKPFNMAEAIRSYRKNGTASFVEQAVVRVADGIKDFLHRVIKRVFHFTKEALEIAVSKFLVEICAMVIAAVCKALMSKHGKAMDITTSGVFYNGGGSAPPNNNTSSQNSGSGQQQSMWAGSAFDSGWSSRGSAW